MNNTELKTEITRLKREKNAIILAHYYTLPEVQEVADFVGDSLGLARKAAETQAGFRRCTEAASVRLTVPSGLRTSVPSALSVPGHRL